MRTAEADFFKQKQLSAEACKKLNDNHIKALSFTPEFEVQQTQNLSSSGWCRRNDIENSNRINLDRIGKVKSIHKKKQCDELSNHKYSLIGSILDKGNNFTPLRSNRIDNTISLNNFHSQHSNNSSNSNNNNDADNSTKNKKNINSIRLGFNPKVTLEESKEMENANSQSCFQSDRYPKADLIIDKDFFCERETERGRKYPKDKHTKSDQDTMNTYKYTAKLGSDYFDVGHVTRYNTFPGHSSLDKESVTQAAHNDTIFLRREPMIDKFCIIKDNYGKATFSWLFQ